MNPDLVYTRFRDEALAYQFTADAYHIFVAMPFAERFSYRSRDVFDGIIAPAIVQANAKSRTAGLRGFAPAVRIDSQPGVAREITDEILKQILFAHFCLADLTLSNDGVFIELGAALALKPNDRVVLITQGRPTDLHFDIKGKSIVQYRDANAIGGIADALFEAAQSFEGDRRTYLTHLSSSLTADAIHLLNWYGQCMNRAPEQRQAVFEDNPPEWFKPPPGAATVVVGGMDLHATRPRMTFAIRELLDKGLMQNDYKPQQRLPEGGPIREMWGYHATSLGWTFIEFMWPDCGEHKSLRRPDRTA